MAGIWSGLAIIVALLISGKYGGQDYVILIFLPFYVVGTIFDLKRAIRESRLPKSSEFHVYSSDDREGFLLFMWINIIMAIAATLFWIWTMFHVIKEIMQ